MEIKCGARPQKENEMVVIVCGPAHSGKSVFFVTLKRELPREGLHLFRACPDGEGTWSQLSDEVVAQELRHKGKFTPEFVAWVVENIRNLKQRVPLVLVDVGGIRSPENEVIFRECDAFVVLCRQDRQEERERWEHFGLELGLEMVASFDSSLEGEDRIDEREPVLHGLATKLERGTKVDSPVARALADVLIEKSGVLEWAAAKKQEGSSKMATINLNQLAESIGVVSVDREITDRATGEKKVVKSFNWRGVNLTPACEAAKKFNAEGEVFVDGGAPAFLYGAIVHAVHPCPKVYFSDPKLKGGKILIPDLPIEGDGNSILDWKVEERESYTFIEFTIPGGIFDEDDLDKIVLPKIESTKGVVISGQGPVYIHGALTKSYCHKVRWTATFAPQQKEDAGGMPRPAIVTTRHHKTAPEVGTYMAC